MFHTLLKKSQHAESKNPFEQHVIDPELVAYMMAFLPPEQVANARKVCRLFNVAGSDNVLWENKRRLHFGEDFAENAHNKEEFAKEYVQQYWGLMRRQRRLISLAIEGDVQGFKKMNLCVDDILALKGSPFNILFIVNQCFLDKEKYGEGQGEYVLNYFYEVYQKTYFKDYSLFYSHYPTPTQWQLICRQNTPDELFDPADTNNVALLRLAIIYGLTDVVKFFVKAGTNIIEAKSSTGMTALLLAAHCANNGAFKFLLKQGADAFAQNERHSTVLHILCSRKKSNCIPFLADHSPYAFLSCMNRFNGYGYYPIHVACNNANIGALKALIAANDNINKMSAASPRDYSMTGLACAMDELAIDPCNSARLAIVRELLNAGADISAQQGDAHSALDFAYGWTRTGHHLEAKNLILCHYHFNEAKKKLLQMNQSSAFFSEAKQGALLTIKRQFSGMYSLFATFCSDGSELEKQLQQAKKCHAEEFLILVKKLFPTLSTFHSNKLFYSAAVSSVWQKQTADETFDARYDAKRNG